MSSNHRDVHVLSGHVAVHSNYNGQHTTKILAVIRSVVVPLYERLLNVPQTVLSIHNLSAMLVGKHENPFPVERMVVI
jgi:hypothetical protein